MNRKREIPCPRCKKPTVYDTKNEYRPFCSERCQLIDRGAWADESHRIPGPAEESGEGNQRRDPDDLENE